MQIPHLLSLCTQPPPWLSGQEPSTLHRKLSNLLGPNTLRNTVILTSQIHFTKPLLWSPLFNTPTPPTCTHHILCTPSTFMLHTFLVPHILLTSHSLTPHTILTTHTLIPLTLTTPHLLTRPIPSPVPLPLAHTSNQPDPSHELVFTRLGEQHQLQVCSQTAPPYCSLVCHRPALMACSRSSSLPCMHCLWATVLQLPPIRISHAPGGGAAHSRQLHLRSGGLQLTRVNPHALSAASPIAGFLWVPLLVPRPHCNRTRWLLLLPST